MKYLFKKTLWLCILPLLIILLPQAIYVKRTTLRLHEAKGSRNKHLALGSDQQHFHLLHLGESTVAGVGVENIEQGLTHQLSLSLCNYFDQTANASCHINYAIHGSNGIRLHELNEQIPAIENGFDMAIVTMGVNDCSKLTPLKKWKEALHKTILRLKQKTNGPIFFTQVPPMAHFPALPSPLKHVLGLRSELLDWELKNVCEQYDNVFHLNINTPLEKEMMAKDGYHPGHLGYEKWAELMTPSIAKTLAIKLNPPLQDQQTQ